MKARRRGSLQTLSIFEEAGAEDLRLLAMTGHTDRVSCVAFSPDGRRILTASHDHTARIWDAATGFVTFSPDGKQVVTGSGNEAHVWDARALALDTQIEWARAAQFDPPSATERFELGLPAGPDMRYRSAKSGDPGALARLAEEEDGLAFRSRAAQRDAHLLQAFRYYAAAAELARLEDWPDEAWRGWRYRRASLARLLAREGMMKEVADAYDVVLEQYGRRPQRLRDWLAAAIGMPR